MAYRLPVFILEIGIWRHDSDLTDPPDITAEANFAQGRRTLGGNFHSPTHARAVYATSYLLLPKDTFILGDTDMAGDEGDTVEVPLGSGWFYHVLHQERTALGFPNEHMTAVIAKLPGVTPKGPTVPDEGGDGILMEDSGFILAQDGERILLEV